MHSVVLFSDDANAQQKILQGLDKRTFYLAAHYSLQSDVINILSAHPSRVCVFQLEQPRAALLDQLKYVNQKWPMPMVLFVSKSDAEMIDGIIDAGISAFVVDGLDVHRVSLILSTAIVRFKRFNALRDELIKAKLSLEERKYVDRAKSLMVQFKGVSENDAHHTLRKLAMENNKRIGQVAMDVIRVLEVMV